jgi:hypothetical protein
LGFAEVTFQCQSKGWRCDFCSSNKKQNFKAILIEKTQQEQFYQSQTLLNYIIK